LARATRRTRRGGRGRGALPAAAAVLALLSLALVACGSSREKKQAGTGKSTAAQASPGTTTSQAQLAQASEKANDNPATILLPSGPAAKQPLATVAGQPVSAAEVSRLLGVGASAGEPVPDPPEYTACIAGLKQGAAAKAAPGSAVKEESPAQLRHSCQYHYEQRLTSALGRAIHNRWLLGEARELGVHVSAREVRQEFDLSKKSFKTQAEFDAYRKQSGQTIPQMMLEIKLGKLADAIFKIAKSKDHPATPGEVAAYYHAHKQQFTVPEGRHIRIVRTATEASALKALQELKAGKSFASVAAELSAIAQPITAKHGEVKNLKPHTYEEKALNDAIFSARPNRLYGPIKLTAQHKTIAPETNTGYFIFEVKGVVPGRSVALSKVSASIAQQLTTLHKNQNLASFVIAFRRKWTARTDCRPGYVIVNFCKQFKQPKGAGSEDPYRL
jgi:foldase protein PrsA